MKVILKSVEKETISELGMMDYFNKYYVTTTINGVEKILNFHSTDNLNILQVEDLVKNHFVEEIELINKVEPIK